MPKATLFPFWKYEFSACNCEAVNVIVKVVATVVKLLDASSTLAVPAFTSGLLL